MKNTHLATFLLASLFLGLAACGGGGEETAPPPSPAPSPPPPPPPAGTVIGAAGGTVTGPSGTSVVIPVGALAADTRILIEQSDAGAPAPPSGFSAGGQMFTFTPHGTTFAVPVTVTLPFDPASVTAGKTPSFYKTDAQDQWQRIPNAVFGANAVTAQVTSFSRIIVFESDLVLGKPVYEWKVDLLKGDGLATENTVDRIANSAGLSEHYDFGATFRDAPVYSFDEVLQVPADNIATAQFAATPNGATWWLGVEAPLGITGAPDNTVGMIAEFKQTQSFIKRAQGALLSFYITEALMQTSDANFNVQRGCPPAHTMGDLCDAVHASVGIDVHAFTVPAVPFTRFETFYRLRGSAQVLGIAGNWWTGANTDVKSRQKVWDIGDFTIDVESIDGNPSALVTFKLTPSVFREYFIDLSSVEVGQAFTVQSLGHTRAYNRAASVVNNRGPEFETSAAAYLRDPRSPQGLKLFAVGLEPIDTVFPVEPPPEEPEAPAPCVPGPGPDPAAGTIQFDAPTYLQLESGVASAVTITRTGGNAGAVTATFRTSDGSAVAGTDYDTLATTVHFGDGDGEPRNVAIDVIQDNASDEPDETVILTLSEPGGCAALGAQTTAVLTIRDDDEPPPPPAFTVSGTVIGLEGTGLTLRDQQFLTYTPTNGPFTLTLPVQSGSPYEVTITAQPIDPVQECTIANGSGIMGNAPVTNVAVMCSTPPPPGGLDPGFGDGSGIVGSTFGGDETDMLLQPDGKILMIGGSSTDFLLARYNADGTVDTSFGGGDGVVTTDIAGGLDAAFGGALLADGRIVVAGSARVGSNDDFALVRYEPDGDLDLSFGTQGKTTTDFFAQRDRAFAVTVQADGKLVVVGDAIVTFGNADFAVARYDASGVLDPAFGAAGTGKVNTDIGGGVDIAKNVVIDADDNILVAGTITMGSSSVLGHTGLARYTPAGALDDSLGTDGTHSLANLSLGEGLALQADGRILVAGSAIVAGDTHFAVMRLERSGSPDGSFGSMGLATVGFTTQDDYGRDVAIDSVGRILVSGQSSNLVNASADFAVARFTPAGVLDAAFDDDGKFTVDFFGSGDSAENVIVQPDGRILLGGFAANGTAVRYGLARVFP